MRRKPWHELPQSTGWLDVTRECHRLGLGPRATEEIVRACRERRFSAKEAIGIVRAFRHKGISWDIAGSIRELRDRGLGPREIIKGVRELGRRPGVKREQCPRPLRREVIRAFDLTCQYCGARGTPEEGPDGKPWAVDRLVPAALGGQYTPDNMTLTCASCNLKRSTKPVPTDTRSLADMRRGGGESAAS